MTDYCDRLWLARYLRSELELEEKLDYLYHLDVCPDCWEKVYSATKATHPHYYKMSARQIKVTERDLARMELKEEEIIEVA